MSSNMPPPPGQDPYQPGYGQDPYQQQPGGYGQDPQQPPYGQAPLPSYGAYATPTGGSSAPVQMPGSVGIAVKLMYAGAALSVISLLSVILLIGQIREQAEESLAAEGMDVSKSLVDGAVTAAVGFAVFFGLIGVALWVWMAIANGKGKSWARITASVFFGLSLLSGVFGFLQPAPMLSHILSVISLVVGAAAIYFMYRPESTAYYRANSGPRY